MLSDKGEGTPVVNYSTNIVQIQYSTSGELEYKYKRVIYFSPCSFFHIYVITMILYVVLGVFSRPGLEPGSSRWV